MLRAGAETDCGFRPAQRTILRSTGNPRDWIPGSPKISASSSSVTVPIRRTSSLERGSPHEARFDAPIGEKPGAGQSRHSAPVNEDHPVGRPIGAKRGIGRRNERHPDPGVRERLAAPAHTVRPSEHGGAGLRDELPAPGEAGRIGPVERIEERAVSVLQGDVVGVGLCGSASGSKNSEFVVAPKPFFDKAEGVEVVGSVRHDRLDHRFQRPRRQDTHRFEDAPIEPIDGKGRPLDVDERVRALRRSASGMQRGVSRRRLPAARWRPAGKGRTPASIRARRMRASCRSRRGRASFRRWRWHDFGESSVHVFGEGASSGCPVQRIGSREVFQHDGELDAAAYRTCATSSSVVAKGLAVNIGGE